MDWTMVPNIIKLFLWLATLLAFYLVPGVKGIDPRCRNVKCARMSNLPACQYSTEYMFEQANRVLVSRRINNWCCCSKADVRTNQKHRKKVHSLMRCFREITHNLNHPPFEFPTDECCSTVLFENFAACRGIPFRTTSKPDNESTSTTASPTSTTTTGKPDKKKSSGKKGATSTTTKRPGDKSTSTTTTTKGPSKSTSSTTTKGPSKSTSTTKATTSTTDKGKSKKSGKSSDDDENEDDED